MQERRRAYQETALSNPVVARLCLDYSEKESVAVIDNLRKVGFRVIVAPVKNYLEPSLTIGSTSLFGLTEIEQFISHVTRESDK